MDNLFLTSPDTDHDASQDAFAFPQSLTEKYRPRKIADFVGLDKPRKIAANLVARPMQSAWMFSGPSGTGKTTLAMAIADEMPAELYHIPSQECNLAAIERARFQCQYVPRNLDDGRPCRWHLVLADEIDKLSAAAQVSMLSKLDATDFFPQTVFIGTTNLTRAQMDERFEPRFLSRFHIVEFSSYGLSAEVSCLLQRVWNSETLGKQGLGPNFQRIVKESNNNVRESLMRLETELMSI